MSRNPSYASHPHREHKRDVINDRCPESHSSSIFYMDPHPPPPNTEPSANFLDTIRTSIASHLTAILGLEVIEAVYASVEVSHNSPHDLTLSVPKLGAGLNDANPDEIAAKVAEEVRLHLPVWGAYPESPSL